MNPLLSHLLALWLGALLGILAVSLHSGRED